MSIESVLSVLGSATPYTLVVEPWATEYKIHPGDKCLLTAIHKNEKPSLSIEIHKENRLIVSINTEGATYRLHRNGVLEIEMPVETILISGRT